MSKGLLPLKTHWDTTSGSRSPQELMVRVNQRIAALSPRGSSRLGRDFLTKLTLSGCRESFRGVFNLPAAYQTFVGSYNTKFSNLIRYGDAGACDLSNLFVYKIHEGVHALQYTRSAGLFTRPTTTLSPYILAPQDFMLMKYYMEMDAYAKQCWLGALADRQFDDVNPNPLVMPVGTERVEEICKGSSCLDGALLQIGVEVMAKSVLFPGKEGPVTFSQYYFERFSMQYAMHLSDPGSNHGEFITVVRLEPDDIWRLGQTIGPNLFGKGRARENVLDLNNLTKFGQRQVQRMNERLGITDCSQIPTLRHMLAVNGLLPEGHVKRARRGVDVRF